MGLAKKIALNTIVQTASKIIATVIGLFTVAIMARSLGQVGFGQYTTVITFISFFAVVADLGLTLVTVQMISSSAEEAGLPAGEAGNPGNGQSENRQDWLLSNLLTLRLVSALIFLGLAPIIIWFFPYELKVKIGVMIATLSFLFPALNQILIGLFQKYLRLDKVSIAEVASRLVLFTGVVAAAYLRVGLYGMLAAMVLASALNFLILFISAKKIAKISLNYSKNLWLEILKKTWPIGLTIFFNLIYLRADTLILSLFKSTADVGVYGAAYKVIDVLITLPFIFAGIVLPIMTSSWQADKENFNRVLQRSFNLMAILAIPLVVGSQFVSSRLMVLIAGGEFAVSGSILKILIAAAGVIFLGTVFSHAIIAIDRQKKIIKAYAFTAATALVGYLIFIPRYSYYGAAWVTIYSELTIALAAMLLIYRETAFRPKLGVAARALLAAAGMAVVLNVFSAANLLLLLTVAVIVYFGLLYLVRGITKAEILELLTRG